MAGLAEKYLTVDVRAKLEHVRANCGFTIDDIVRSGVKNPDSSIGAYSGDEDCYRKFSPLFDRIIEDYHGHPPNGVHKSNLNMDDMPVMADLDPEGKAIVSTRIRVARNLKGFPFPPAVSVSERAGIEQSIVSVLTTLEGELSGHYFPLYEMSEETRIKLTEDHFLFKKGDRFLEAAGINRDWPESRGIFHSGNKRFLVWINEEDELRIISMQAGGDIRAVFERLVKGIAAIGEKLPFAYNDHLGYLTSCPTNLGTAMRASVHIKLPRLIRSETLSLVCQELGLSVRGIHGEHSESVGGVCDVSNKQRLGINEVDCISRLYDGIGQLLDLEREME